MTTALLIVHLFVTLALIGVVLIQRSEGGGLGVGTSQGMGGFMSGRGTANLLTRSTAILAAMFFALSLGLALLNRGTTVSRTQSILDVPPPRAVAPAVPVPPSPPATVPTPPAAPAPPVVVPAAPPAQPAPAGAAPDASTPALPDAPPPPPADTGPAPAPR